MTRAEFKYFERELKKATGMTLKCFPEGNRKRYFQRCLRPRLRELGFKTYGEYKRYLSGPRHGRREWSVFVGVIRANRTRFFRERTDWEPELRATVARWLKTSRPGRDFTVLSAACSSGQEAFSIALVLEKLLKGTGRSYQVLGVDVNRDVIELARFGIYPAAPALREIPTAYHSMLKRVGGSSSRFIMPRESVRARVKFVRGNLLKNVAGRGRFDAIFCRNLIYYLDERDSARVLDLLFERAKPGAFLFTGRADAEALPPSRWVRVRRCALRR